MFGAIDIGASGGRVMAGIVTDGQVELELVHRFSNGVVERDGSLHWDVTRLFGEVLDGLTALAARYGAVVSLGIDTWAVDYGLLDADGALIGDPYAYRDDRTDGLARRGPRTDRRSRAVRRHRPAVPALQHDLPARRGAAGSTLGGRGDAAAPPRPARVLAHRRSSLRGHERLDDRAVRRDDPGLVTARRRTAGLSISACWPRSSRPAPYGACCSPASPRGPA